ncbi:hypothetical protein, partial [Paraburkholderia sp. SIMBA_030]|uniref:hypothetical protein n=1 Tax=Paraburkholderia sp. SIMBA_030 TaxID=3085773 RepID=UPI00397A4ACF
FSPTVTTKARMHSMRSMIVPILESMILDFRELSPSLLALKVTSKPTTTPQTATSTHPLLTLKSTSKGTRHVYS